MKRRFQLLALMALLAGGTASLSGQEQTFNIGGPQHVLDDPARFVDINSATMTESNAQALITATLGTAAMNSKNFHCIIHILRWNDAGKVDKQSWYVYSKNESGWSDTQFQGLRIFGSHNIALLYVHLNAQGATFDSVAAFRGPSSVLQDLYKRANAGPAASKVKVLRYVLASRSSGNAQELGDGELRDAAAKPEDPRIAQALNTRGWDTQDLTSLESLYVSHATDAVRGASADVVHELSGLSPGGDCKAKDSNGLSLVRVGHANSCVPQYYSQVTYKVEVTKKLPSAISDLFKLATLNGNQVPDKVKMEPVALWGGQAMNIGPVPSDVKVTPSVTTSGSDTPTALESRTYDNEGRYFWDISAGIPLRSINETTYDATAGTLTAKNVSKQSLYAMFNVFPFKVDTKGTNYRWLTPALLMGMGVTGKPLDRLMAGGGLGLNKIQFFAGCAFTKKQFPGLASNPAATTMAYRTNLIFGLNVPIRQVLQTLKAAK